MFAFNVTRLKLKGFCLDFPEVNQNISAKVETFPCENLILMEFPFSL